MKGPSGRSFERLVAAIQHTQSEGATVTWNDSINERQFDVTIRFKYGLHSYLTVIECKDFSSKVPVEKVEAFVTKAHDAKANKAVIVSSHGFQSGCYDVAERHNVELLVLTETSDTPVAEVISKIRPGLRVTQVCFVLANGQGVVEFEDWGGKLAYLMKHSRLIQPQATTTIDRLIHNWQLSSYPTLEPGQEYRFELPLVPTNCKLKTPTEAEAVYVTAMRFSCSLINVHFIKGTGLDAHILARKAKKFELRDQKGELQYSALLADIPLGFDTTLTVGKFYEIPDMFSRYFCEKIEGDTVFWTMVESYQHGDLVQVRYKDYLKNAGYYVEITDEKIIQHLKSLLVEPFTDSSAPAPSTASPRIGSASAS